MVWTQMLFLASQVSAPISVADIQQNLPSEDLRCFAVLTSVANTASKTLKKSDADAFDKIAYFYHGRLSVIDPKVDWVWIAAGEKLPSSDQEWSATVLACGERWARLTHLADK